MIRSRRSVLPAAALVIGATLASCGEYNGIQQDGEPAPATSSPQPEAKSSDVVIDVRELSDGPAPRIAWLDGRTLHDGDREIRLTGEPYEVAVVNKRIVELGPTQSATDSEVLVRNRRGDIRARYPDPVSRLATNAERNIVAWIAEDNRPMILQTGHKQALEMPREPKGRNGDPVAVVGKDCFNGPETVVGAGCTVFFMLSIGDQTVPYESSEHGIVAPVDTEIDELFDVSQDRAMIGGQASTDSESCSRFEREDKSYETCDYLLYRFSPDARHILGHGPEIGEGPATDTLHLIDARTGESVRTIRSPADSYTLWEAAWEDDSHLLVVVNQDETTWAIVRIGLDGSAELAAGPKESDSDTTYGFAVQP